MSRGLTANVATASLAESFTWILFCYLDYPSGAVRVCNLRHSKDWNGFTWIGVGKFGSLDPVRESTDLATTRVRVQLSGIDAALLSLNLNDKIQGRTATIWLGLLDTNYAVIDAPTIIWDGRMDVPEFTYGKSATIALSIEHYLADRDRPRMRRYNNADQQAEFVGDAGMDYAEKMIDAELLWGFNG